MAQLEELLRTGREGRALELKRSMSWADPATKGKVIRTALSLANLRDGGSLAFGLEQVSPNPSHNLVGMGQADHDSFSQDSVSATVNTYATPHVDLAVEHLKIDGLLFVAVVVQQFSDYPVVCAKDFLIAGRPVVVGGRLYCRSRRTPETTEVRTPEDMREIIDLATARGLERYFRLRDIEGQFEGPSARERFDEQLGDL